MTRNNGNLQKQYDKLTARERLMMIYAAWQRGDENERLALIDSAPRVSYRLSHHHGAVEALNLAAMWHVLRQLERAWTVSTLGHIGENNNDAWRAAKMAAYLFCVEADAWRAFCQDLGIDPDAALTPLPGTDGTLEFAERIAREMAYTPEAAAAELLAQEGEGAQMVTVESRRADMRAFFDQWAARWE